MKLIHIRAKVLGLNEDWKKRLKDDCDIKFRVSKGWFDKFNPCNRRISPYSLQTLKSNLKKNINLEFYIVRISSKITFN